MTTCLFIVSFWRDFPWLPYLFKSIGRQVSGFDEIVLAVPNRDVHLLKPFNLTKERVVTFDETIDGHIHHCYIKLTADEYTKADLITYIDSDCVFIAPTTPEYFQWLGKPILLFTPFEIRDGKEWPSHWRAGAEAALGHKVEVETMRRHGITYHRSTLANLRDYMENLHKAPLLDYLRPFKQGTFSEFCTAGAYAYYHEPMKYHLRHDENAPPRTDHQFWSHWGVNNPGVKAKLKEFDLL